MKYKDEDIDNWPKTWSYTSKDILYGKKIIQLFIPFIKSLKDSKLSKKTINDHIDNLWILGGYIIKEVNRNEKYRDWEPCMVMPRYIDSIDGPTIFDLSEDEQESFDRTCRKYYKYYIFTLIINKRLNKYIRI